MGPSQIITQTRPAHLQASAKRSSPPRLGQEAAQETTASARKVNESTVSTGTPQEGVGIGGGRHGREKGLFADSSRTNGNVRFPVRHGSSMGGLI